MNTLRHTIFALALLASSLTGASADDFYYAAPMPRASVQPFASSADLSKTSDVTLAAVPGLSVSLANGGVYHCSGHLAVSSGVSGGLKAQFVAAGGLTASGINFAAYTWNGTTAVAHTVITSLASAFVANTAIITDVYIQGSMMVTASGSIGVQAAQNASNGTASVVQTGSALTCLRQN